MKSYWKLQLDRPPGINVVHGEEDVLMQAVKEWKTWCGDFNRDDHQILTINGYTDSADRAPHEFNCLMASIHGMHLVRMT